MTLPSTSAAQREALLPLLAAKAYRHGQFTLASGRTSHHYVNCKPVSLSGPGLALLGALMLEHVEADAVAVAGLTAGLELRSLFLLEEVAAVAAAAAG